jgi:hypothetical protein
VGVTDAEQLRQAVAIDQAGEELISETCLARHPYALARPASANAISAVEPVMQEALLEREP